MTEPSTDRTAPGPAEPLWKGAVRGTPSPTWLTIVEQTLHRAFAGVPDLDDHDYATESLYGVLRTAASPVRPSVGSYEVEAVAATAEEHALLDLPPGVPLLVARQTTRDQHGRVCELGATRYRGDRYRFHATLGLA